MLSAPAPLDHVSSKHELAETDNVATAAPDPDDTEDDAVEGSPPAAATVALSAEAEIANDADISAGAPGAMVAEDIAEAKDTNQADFSASESFSSDASSHAESASTNAGVGDQMLSRLPSVISRLPSVIEDPSPDRAAPPIENEVTVDPDPMPQLAAELNQLQSAQSTRAKFEAIAAASKDEQTKLKPTWVKSGGNSNFHKGLKPAGGPPPKMRLADLP